VPLQEARDDLRATIRAPARPFILLGRLRETVGPYDTRRFAFAVAPGQRPGLYRVFLYCRPCGGSLLQSGHRMSGETLRIT
jgi:hypothetical protein